MRVATAPVDVLREAPAEPSAFSCFPVVDKVRELWNNPLVGRVAANWQEAIFTVATAICVIGVAKAFFAGNLYYAVSFLVLTGISLIGRHLAQLYSIAETFKEEAEKFKKENIKLEKSVQELVGEVDKFSKGNTIFGKHLNKLNAVTLDNAHAANDFSATSKTHLNRLARNISKMAEEYDKARKFVEDVQGQGDTAMKERLGALESLYDKQRQVAAATAEQQAKYDAYTRGLEEQRKALVHEQAAFIAGVKRAFQEQLGAFRGIPGDIQQQMQLFQQAAQAELEKFVTAISGKPAATMWDGLGDYDAPAGGYAGLGALGGSGKSSLTAPLVHQPSDHSVTVHMVHQPSDPHRVPHPGHDVKDVAAAGSANGTAGEHP